MGDLPTEILTLPIGHLGVSERTRLAVHDSATIGSLLRSYTNRRFQSNPPVDREVGLILQELNSCFKAGGDKCWELFRSRRPSPSSPTSVFFTSNRLGVINREEVSRPVGTLHPGTRAATAFERARILTVGDLIEASKRGLVNARPAGAGTCQQIIGMLESLCVSVLDSGQIDWNHYVRLQGIAVIPAVAISPMRWPETLGKTFFSAIKAACELKFGEPGRLILEKDVFATHSRRLTMVQIASLLGLPRQEVKRIKDNVLETIRRAVLEGDYTACGFRFQADLCQPIQLLATQLEKVCGHSLAYSDWERIMRSKVSVAPADFGEWSQPLLGILGFRIVLPICPKDRPIIISKNKRALQLRRAVQRTRQILSANVNGLTAGAIFSRIRSRDTYKSVVRHDVGVILKSLAGVIKVGSGNIYRCSLSDLKSVNDRLERALQCASKPMHFRQLAALLRENPRKSQRGLSERSITTALCLDSRFRPIARTGFWILASWNEVETRTLTDLAAEALASRRRPLTEKELHDEISSRRPVAQSSIRGCLVRDPRFKRVAPLTWALIT